MLRKSKQLTLAAIVIAWSSIAAIACFAAPTTGTAPLRKEIIHDPVLNMDAYEVAIPAKWHFAGTIFQGTSCGSVPFPVFRASSPDGLTVLERMPRLDWMWGNSPLISAKQGDCLPLKQALSAKDFLKYLAETMKVEYVSDDPVPQAVVDASNKNLEAARAAYAPKYAAAGMKQPTETLQMARAIVRYTNGSFVMKGVLAAAVDCTQAQTHVGPSSPTWTLNTCTANVRYIHAPEAQYDAAIKLLDGNPTGAAEIPQWSQAWIENSKRQTQANINQMRAQSQAAMAQTRASAAQFQHSQDVRQHMHEEFLSTMQRGTTMSMNRTAEAGNARHRAASDWVDYSLDQQTVRDPNSGQVTKVSSANTYTWIDSTGKLSYQTNDPNANPNGTLQGNWTRQNVVHGDGSSY